MSRTQTALGLRVPLALVRLTAWIVPRGRRESWRRQWTADLHGQWVFLQQAGARRPTWDLWSRGLGMVTHAITLRLRSWTMKALITDVRYGVRQLQQRPGFTAVAVLLLALGMGATTTIFSWADGLVLHPIPGATHADRVVAVKGTTPTRRDISVSYPNFADMRDQAPGSIAGMTALRLVAVNLRTTGEPQRAWAELVTGEFFDVLGVTPAAGRLFTRDDDRVPDGHPVAVISHQYWQTRFNADPAVVGATATINGRAFTVIGVTAPSFIGASGAMNIDLWVPMMMQTTVMAGSRLDTRGNAWLQVLARLSPQATVEQAQAGLQTVAGTLATAYPDVNTDRGVAVYPLWSAPGTAASILGPVLGALLVVMALVLLVVCANLASLMLARATGRRREIAVRLALGASRGRIIRQLLTESLVLAMLGGLAGLAVTVWASQMLDAFIPPSPQPLTGAVALSWRIPLLGLGLVIVTTVLCGLAPALQSTRPALVPALKESKGALGGGRRGWLRSGLVVGQVALSMVLLIGAGLFIRTVQQSRDADVGFDMTDGLLASVDLLPGGYGAERGTALYRQLLAEVAVLPGVERVGLGRDIPLKLGGGSDTQGSIEGYTAAEGEEITLFYDRVTPDFLPTLGIPLKDGRGFTDQDDADHPNVLLINETMARRYWKGRSPIGGRVNLGEWFTVVGVVGDAKYTTLNAAPVSFMYLPLYASYQPDVTLLVRTSGAPMDVLAGVRNVMGRLDPDLPLFDVRSMEEHRLFVSFIPSFAATLLGAFGVVALALATVGLYGVLLVTVGQRTPEIGVRVALGAQRHDILKLIGGHGLTLTLIGGAIGLGLATVLMPLVASQLVGVGARDVLTYALAGLLLLGGAATASYLPARRAARVDPLRALRYE